MIKAITFANSYSTQKCWWFVGGFVVKIA